MSGDDIVYQVPVPDQPGHRVVVWLLKQGVGD